MRVMVIIKADNYSEAGMMPGEKLLTDMGKYNEELVNAGLMLTGEGLHPSSKGAKVNYSHGKVTVIDGPFTEAKELIAGFSLVQAKSLDEAIELVKRWPAEDASGDLEIRIRQVAGAEDFADLPQELRDQEERQRVQAASQSSGR